jgi:SAM-dependent methyltransferase
MTSPRKDLSKELYKRLRVLSCTQLWEEAVARFDRAPPQERIQTVAVVRAVGVVFSGSGTMAQKNEAKSWLLGLLRDPSEKIRRYAMAALPKIGAGVVEETALLRLLTTSPSEHEKRFLGAALEKIGGTATLDEVARARGGLPQIEQKIKATLARTQHPSTVRLDRALSKFDRLRIHLRSRKGLEQIVRAEVEEYASRTGRFRIMDVRSGLVTIAPVTPFSLADVYALRCFGTVGFVLGAMSNADVADSIDALASVITSPLSRRILETFTDGSLRYRLEFVSKGHQRGAVRLLSARAYAKCPEILNDARSACWTIAIYPTERGNSVELCPRLPHDPRFNYRLADVPAASHPPLAACMARLAGRVNNDVVWDPFCGSGLELVERALLGSVRSVFGTDRSAEAIDIARNNFAAADVKSVPATFTCRDFREFASIHGLGPNTATLIITNPPMGKRVPVGNLRQLIADLISVAATVLQPGGRLVFANPVREAMPHPSLKLQSSQIVDLGILNCRLQKYVKV